MMNSSDDQPERSTTKPVKLRLIDVTEFCRLRSRVAVGVVGLVKVSAASEGGVPDFQKLFFPEVPPLLQPADTQSKCIEP
jgi:hypothetical protein